MNAPAFNVGDKPYALLTCNMGAQHQVAVTVNTIGTADGVTWNYSVSGPSGEILTVPESQLSALLSAGGTAATAV